MTHRTSPPASPLVLAALAVLLAAGGEASAQEFGTIKGRLVWSGAAMPKAEPKPASVCSVGMVPDESILVDPKTKGVANGFAYVVNPEGANPEAEKALLAKAPEVVIDQKGCRFVPHAVALHKGQTLVFTSHDTVPHNVNYSSTGRNGSQNMMVTVGGRLPVSFVAGDRHPTPFVCNIHNWMGGTFMVFDHPFFALTKPDGSFEIAGVPAGTQRLIVRQEKIGFATEGGTKGVEVVVWPGNTTDVGEIKLVPKP